MNYETKEKIKESAVFVLGILAVLCIAAWTLAKAYIAWHFIEKYW